LDELHDREFLRIKITFQDDVHYGNCVVTMVLPAWQWHHRFGNTTRALFISHWWQCWMKFTTVPINWG